ncbi:putative protein kinase RLK-Pelle-CR4L family [Helianthus annuus]|nr:putative protein kinase RLK-Pelle-CR4L family [Helianthus annuus]
MSFRSDLDHLRIPLQEILSATNNFSDQNLIREGGFGKIFKGKLGCIKNIDIVARRFDPKYGQGDTEFWTEVSMLSTLEHPNLVSFIGFCDEAEEKIIVTEYEVNSSLDKYLSDPTLTWTQRLHICIGVARAISYLYWTPGPRINLSVIHRNIKSSKILLDHNWEPKLSGYELSVQRPAAKRDRHLIRELSGTYGYVDPVYAKAGKVSHKSDVFSLGVVLFEVLCGRRAFIPDKFEDEEQSLMFTMKRLKHFNVSKDRLISRLARSHYEEGKLDDIINRDLRNQMEQRSYLIFSHTAYLCLNEKQEHRPNIYLVVHRLKRALKLQQEYCHVRSFCFFVGSNNVCNRLKKKQKCIQNGFQLLADNNPKVNYWLYSRFTSTDSYPRSNQKP